MAAADVGGVPSNRTRVSDDLVWASLSILAVLLANLAMSAILARRGISTFEVFNLGKRVAATAVPVLVMGLNLGLAKTLAEVEGASRLRRLTAGYRLVLVSMVGISALFVLAPGLRTVFGGTSGWEFWTVWMYTLGMACNLIVYSAHRGSLAQAKANRNNMLAVGLLPIAVVLVLPATAPSTLLLAAIGAILLASQGSRIVWTAYGPRAVSLTRLEYATLLRFSLPRLPAGLLAAAALAAGPWIVHRAGIPTDAAFLLAGLSVVQLAGAAFAGFSMVLLPRISAMTTSGEIGRARTTVGGVVSLMLIACAAAVPVLYVGMDTVVELWLGSAFITAAPVLRVFVIGVPAVVLYGVLTSVTDAAVKLPVNTIGAGLALIGALAPVLMGEVSAQSMAFGFVAGQWMAALVVSGATVSVLGWGVFREVSGIRLLVVVGVTTGANLVLSGVFTRAPLVGLGLAALVAALVAVLGLRGTAVSSVIRSRMKAFRAGRVSS